MAPFFNETVGIITVLLSALIVHTEKLHFSKYLDTEKDLLIFRSHALVLESVEKCVENCKSINDCKYINYHVTTNLCDLIESNAGNDVDNDDKVDWKKGYVFGKKSDWTLKTDSGCLVCKGDGTCTVDSDKDNVCHISGCKPPDPKPHTVVRGNMLHVGNKVKYECIGKRKMAGAKRHTSTCLGNGTWSATDFQCLLDCGLLPSINKGVVSLDSPGISTEGATATVTCISGYAPDIAAITCQPSGIWESPVCKRPMKRRCLSTRSSFICNNNRWNYAVSAACGSCVAECVDGVDELTCSCTENLQRFISLPGYYIPDYNVGRVRDRRTEAECMAACRATPGCKSVDYINWTYGNLQCAFNNIQPHEVEPVSHTATSILLRQCDVCYNNNTDYY